MSGIVTLKQEEHLKTKNGIEYLIGLNETHSTLFSDPSQALARRRYRAEHPTEIAALKCMDGRVHLPVMTNTPLGIIQPFRNLGGRFNMGWPMFQAAIKEWVDYSVSRGRNCLVLVTYHYSNGDVHRGCRGFEFDAQAAQKETANLRNKFDDVFGRGTVYTIQVGIETDGESLILHGENGDMVDLAEVAPAQDLIKLVERLYPHMPERIRLDLLPLVEGNIQHVAEVSALNRGIEAVEHREWALAIGRGFDWLHEINTALIVGPFSPDLATPIETAAGVIKGNLDGRRIAGKRIVLMTSAPFRDSAGPEPHLAAEKALFLSDFALEVVRRAVPELIPHMEVLAARVDMNTRRLEVLKRMDSVV